MYAIKLIHDEERSSFLDYYHVYDYLFLKIRDILRNGVYIVIFTLMMLLVD